MIKEFFEFQDYIYEIRIGKNAQENWDLISVASQNDIWFHLGSGLSSPHVILIIPENFKLKKIPNNVIYKCANLCKQYSKAKEIPNVKVIYTLIKNVKKADKIGSVTTQKTIEITV
jgi:predicted ribosome quality control (RQC) complex YloA/Tae2 family protein